MINLASPFPVPYRTSTSPLPRSATTSPYLPAPRLLFQVHLCLDPDLDLRTFSPLSTSFHILLSSTCGPTLPHQYRIRPRPHPQSSSPNACLLALARASRSKAGQGQEKRKCVADADRPLCHITIGFEHQNARNAFDDSVRTHLPMQEAWRGRWRSAAADIANRKTDEGDFTPVEWKKQNGTRPPQSACVACVKQQPAGEICISMPRRLRREIKSPYFSRAYLPLLRIRSLSPFLANLFNSMPRLAPRALIVLPLRPRFNLPALPAWELVSPSSVTS
ncbi:hypothetical protein R3P38DRAFT_3470624 [Favolaschia claudopus]|uniref:Uncharacterized protein n=1 Tax=Favolaschia claudopus TaxID=2862362 RepID=A0AAV9ZCT3_9AGAR